MLSWLEKPWSLSFANRKNLIERIKLLETNITHIKEALLGFNAVVNQWEMHYRELSELSSAHQLTAKHILHVKPILENSEEFKKTLNELMSRCALDPTRIHLSRHEY